jgi:hypothetical protein
MQLMLSTKCMWVTKLGWNGDWGVEAYVEGINEKN